MTLLNRQPTLRARAERYREVAADPGISGRTSFFHAAHVVTEVLACGPVTRFMTDLSGQLERLNQHRAELVRAGQLYFEGAVLSNTADFIRFEQTQVQKELDRLRSWSPPRYREEILQMNRNMRTAALWMSRFLSPAHAVMYRALHATRVTLGSWPDFSRQREREILGLHLVLQATPRPARGRRQSCAFDPRPLQCNVPPSG